MAAARRAVLAAAFALFTIFDALIFVPLGGGKQAVESTV